MPRPTICGPTPLLAPFAFRVDEVEELLPGMDAHLDVDFLHMAAHGVLGDERLLGNERDIPGLYNVGTMVGDSFANAYTFQIPGFNLGMNCITFGYLTGKYIAENE